MTKQLNLRLIHPDENLACLAGYLIDVAPLLALHVGESVIVPMAHPSNTHVHRLVALAARKGLQVSAKPSPEGAVLYRYA